MSLQKKPTPRSRLLGLYIQAKSLCWITVGVALAWGFGVAGDMGSGDGFRAFAYFLIIFLVPGILLWVLGVIVRVRIRAAWWFAVTYFVVVVITKAGAGSTDLPWQAWSWVSTRLPTFYIRGFQAFAVFSTAVLAADVAALASFISPQGRACFGVGKASRDTLEDATGVGEA